MKTLEQFLKTLKTKLNTKENLKTPLEKYIGGEITEEEFKIQILRKKFTKY